MELIIETSFYQDVYPAENHDVYSFVGRFCEKNGITLPIPFDESKISMQVQSLERTFIDKVFAVYNNITKKLLYEDVSYNDAIEKGIALVTDMDIFEYIK